MQLYKVGGAVRDELLGYPHEETDWVVVGATPQELLDMGYRQVGKDFPVFLHPDTKEEFALARTERKSGPGYHGFEIHAAPTVTLEEDLQRRDLTINAMAQDDAGNIIDPYGGQADLTDRVLRHVSPHFAEDPLRVLRVARFAARYAHLGFSVASETLELMHQLVEADELAHLSTERIWVETQRALGEEDPAVYFETLNTCGALHKLLPALAVSQGIALLERAARHTDRSDCRWAALLADLPPDRAVASSERIKAPNACRDLAGKVAEWRPKTKAALTSAEACMSLLEAVDALRREEPFTGFCTTIAALEDENAHDNAACQLLIEARDAANGVTAALLAAEGAAEGLTGPELGKGIRRRRVEKIERVLALDHH